MMPQKYKKINHYEIRIINSILYRHFRQFYFDLHRHFRHVFSDLHRHFLHTTKKDVSLQFKNDVL